MALTPNSGRSRITPNEFTSSPRSFARHPFGVIEIARSQLFLCFALNKLPNLRQLVGVEIGGFE
jgi:hypothetical protein